MIDRCDYLIDLHSGETITGFASPMDGTVIYVVVSPAMGAGELLEMVGKVLPPTGQ